jgi:hypothetical protein
MYYVPFFLDHWQYFFIFTRSVQLISSIYGPYFHEYVVAVGRIQPRDSVSQGADDSE